MQPTSAGRQASIGPRLPATAGPPAIPFTYTTDISPALRGRPPRSSHWRHAKTTSKIYTSTVPPPPRFSVTRAGGTMHCSRTVELRDTSRRRFSPHHYHRHLKRPSVVATMYIVTATCWFYRKPQRTVAPCGSNSMHRVTVTSVCLNSSYRRATPLAVYIVLWRSGVTSEAWKTCACKLLCVELYTISRNKRSMRIWSIRFPHVTDNIGNLYTSNMAAACSVSFVADKRKVKGGGRPGRHFRRSGLC